MSDGSKIEWTEATANPIRARSRGTGKVGWFCTHVSPGCANCYAEGFNARLGTGLSYKPAHLPHVEIALEEKVLRTVLGWRRPRMIFWGSMTDLFAEFVTDEMLDRIFAVMALTPQHVHQVLTKRPERMRAYMERACGRIADAIIHIRRDRGDADMVVVPLSHIKPGAAWWPLPNVWLGVSVEDQARADERIPILLDTPAAVRWISAEPLLGPIDLTRIPFISDAGNSGTIDALAGERYFPGCGSISSQTFRGRSRLDWVVVGGESGPDARPMHPDWARSLRDQCAAAGVPFLFKQWGSCLPCSWDGEDERGRMAYVIDEEHSEVDYDELGRAKGVEAHGREFARFGHKKTGRRLDGVQHDGFPAGAGV